MRIRNIGFWKILDASLIAYFGGYLAWQCHLLLPGRHFFQEPNKVILVTEIVVLIAISLYGVIRFLQATLSR